MGKTTSSIAPSVGEAVYYIKSFNGNLADHD